MAAPLPQFQSDNQAMTQMQNAWASQLNPLLQSWQTLKDSLSAIVPTGSILPYAGGTVPSGFLLCDGSEVPIVTYPDLYAALGKASNTWGTPANSSNIKLPDLRGRTLIGAGTGSGLTARVLGTTGGEENHVLSLAEIPAHNHNVRPASGTSDGTTNSVMTSSSTANVFTNPAFMQNAGSGNAHNNMQPYAVVNWIIKT